MRVTRARGAIVAATTVLAVGVIAVGMGRLPEQARATPSASPDRSGSVAEREGVARERIADTERGRDRIADTERGRDRQHVTDSGADARSRFAAGAGDGHS